MPSAETKATHTPGPWIIFQDSGPPPYRVVMPAGRAGEIAEIRASKDGCQDANARLIAAAPELLSVCEELVGALKDGSIIRSDKFESDDATWLLDKARTALAKAKGEA